MYLVENSHNFRDNEINKTKIYLKLKLHCIKDFRYVIHQQQTVHKSWRLLSINLKNTTSHRYQCFYYFKAFQNYNFSINKEIAVRWTKILRRTIKYIHYSKNLLNMNFPQFIVLLIPGLCISPYKGALTLTKLARRQNIINQRKLFQSKNVKTFFGVFKTISSSKGKRCH